MTVKYNFKWDEDTGVCICYFNSPLNGNYIEAKAICHAEDSDMKNRRTGEGIAASRADIKMVQDYIRNTLKPGLAALKQLYYTMKHSSKYSPRGYEAKKLYKHIRMFEEEIADCKQLIADCKAELSTYLKNKDMAYKIIRKKRKQSNS